MKKLFYLMMAGALALGSCGNDDEPAPEPAPDPIAVASVTLDKTELTFHRGESASLVATVAPADATDKAVAWRSSDDKVATVNDKGLVSAVEPGTATITATGGGKSATCTVTVEPDVYVVGYKSNADYLQRKTYLWKNGQAAELPLKEVRSVFVSEGKVYVAGAYKDSNMQSPTCAVWEDGEMKQLEGATNTYGQSVFVSAGNVYVAGHAGGNSGYLWTNGNIKQMTERRIASQANSVFVSGQDVYVAGNRAVNAPERAATYWKNGAANDLTDGTNSASLYSLVVADGTVYAAGVDNRKAVLWEGSKRTELPDGSNAASVAVSEKGDVYVAGTTNGRSALWKNGELTELSTERTVATSVFIYGDDIYVAGGYNIESSKAKLWINGKETTLPEGNYATSVFVY